MKQANIRTVQRHYPPRIRVEDDIWFAAHVKIRLHNDFNIISPSSSKSIQNMLRGQLDEETF